MARHPDRWSRTTANPSRARKAILLWTAAPLLGVALAASQAPEPTGDDPRLSRPTTGESAAAPAANVQRIREGTEIVDQTGHFQMAGDRVVFFTEDGQGGYVALENLNLERIAQAIAENPEKLQWSVTGTMTEYRGANYLFVRRAIQKSRIESTEEAF
ncbi:MAG: hypothetical protein JXB62_21220 [Pirellulales bacterium]|nr:hypothetical protein [Pirellulales bacterium]